jgi:hypothetical protein
MKKKDEGFTNIRIREDTREKLRRLGTYNESMDDIVMKCIDAYNKFNSKEYQMDQSKIDELTKNFAELRKQLGL